MKTGDSQTDNFIENGILDQAIEILKPVIESSIIFAAHYSKKCGRDSITGKDVHLGRMFAARTVVGKQIGSLFPEVYKNFDEVDEIMDEGEGEWETESDDEQAEEVDEDEQAEEVDEDDEPWTLYVGDDEMANQMNICADTFNDWVPQNPIEEYLKKAIGIS